MATKASTHRLDPELQSALDHLSKLLHRPKNRLINEAVQIYVQQRGRAVERELESTLAALRAYRGKDPDFESAIHAFAEAEVAGGAEDPAAGRLTRTTRSVRAEIRGLLHA